MKPNNQRIAYSDGTAEEDRLYQIVCSVADKSVLSDELTHYIDDWVTEYHFSRYRHCLLKHLPIRDTDQILELGAGCGAMTRYLGETGAMVHAVEGSPRRAKIAAERCADLTQVMVFVEDLSTFESTIQYDWVLLIGVLEYAPIFSQASNPIQSYLDAASKYLKPNGKLVIAIENKLGLKYFNGCNEDHVNVPFFGIENRYTKQTPITFGKIELETILKNVGFDHVAFHYPFPDYKITRLLIENLPDSPIELSELLRGISTRDYAGQEYRAFHEAFVWPELEKNQLIGDLSNSFLVLASKAEIPRSSTVAHYYNMNRYSRFATVTQFYLQQQTMFVKKAALLPSRSKTTDIYQMRDLHEKYVHGATLQTVFEKHWHTFRNYTELQNVYTEWVTHLISISNMSQVSSVSRAGVNKHFIDYTPFNVKVHNDSLIAFDQEWQSPVEIPLLWLVFRGIYWSLYQFNTTHYFKITVDSWIMQILSQLEIVVTSEDLQDAKNREIDFQHATSGKSLCILPVIEKYPSKWSSLQAAVTNLEKELHEKKLQLASVQAIAQHQTENLTQVEAQLTRYRNFFPIKLARALRRLLINVFTTL